MRSGGARLDTDPIGDPPPLVVTSSDGVILRGVALPGPASTQGPAIVVCHGFTHHTAHPTTRRVLRAFARHAAVYALDMRGHGRSGGRNTVGDREAFDLDAAVGAARAAGHRRVVTVGFSLGGAVALRHAALGSERPDAVVSVSAPARWYSRETPPMRRVHWLVEQPHGRLVARMLGLRLGTAWTAVPPSPVEVVAAIAPVPLLVVHFAGDPYFSALHARALATAGGATLWMEPSAGHGESGSDADLIDRIAGWAVAPDGAPR